MPRPEIVEVQRARILNAAVDVIGVDGYGGMSVARITARARVSRRTFYDLFEDREDCFLAVFEDAVSRATHVAAAAASGERSWRARVRAGLAALLSFAGDEPVLGSLLVKDALAAGPTVLASRARVLDTLHTIVDHGRTQTKAGAEPPPLTPEGIVGAVLAVVHARMLDPDSGLLIELLNPLMGMIVAPYLGRAAATRELSRPVPDVARAEERIPRDPLDGLQMRITYRTLRVLAAIAGRPGASNREIGEEAGVADQGQISKLLARLEHLGLIHNVGTDTQAKGEPNAWALTPRGREIETTVSIGAA
jgi:AcrR family transcriptional regulator